MHKLIVIAGPTATGKTELAAFVAERLNGEIISADSMQVYKYLDIGTAKPRNGEYPGAVFHLIDFLDPASEFTVADFCRLAHNCVNDAAKRKRVPIVAGGTGFYIKALLYNAGFSAAPPDSNYRRILHETAISGGADSLHEALRRVDAESAAAIHKNNTARVVRALEYFYRTGEKISAANAETAKNERFYDFLFVETGGERARMYENINRRVDRMINDGLKDETERVLCLGYGKNIKPLRAIGYKEMLEHIGGGASLAETAERIKQNTRRYAKRQVTWFKNQFSAEKIYAANLTKKEISEKCAAFLERK